MRKHLIICTLILLILFPVRVYASADTIVYKTMTGECYHKANCGSLKKSRIEITLQEAVDSGLRPCGNCHPPVLGETNDSSDNNIVSETPKTYNEAQENQPTPEPEVVYVEKVVEKEDSSWKLPVGASAGAGIGAGAVAIANKLMKRKDEN